jgi:endonuclease/exonuclease/phosphatase family metal-dependent hydrolase
VAVTLGAAPVLAADDPDGPLLGAPGRLGVVTQNQYLGADLGPLLGAPDRAAFNAAVVALLRQIAATDFPARAERQAAEIAAQAPDLVGLQEVWHLGCRDLGPPTAGQGCDSPLVKGAFVDHLRLTEKALAAKGAAYRPAAVVRNFDTASIKVPLPGVDDVRGLPFTLDGMHYSLVLAYDRDVILARKGVEATPVRFGRCAASVDGCHYLAEVSVTVPALGRRVAFERGFVAVDARVRGRRYRFVDTHLETREPSGVQSKQAIELARRLAAGPRPRSATVLAGDTNSSPADPPFGKRLPTPYRVFAKAGFADVWTAAGPHAGAGFTCCQDSDLRNAKSELHERVDLILSRPGPARVDSAALLGAEPTDKTASGLWPSDHAGVAAVLRY